MMTVEGRELPQPPQGAAHQKAYSLPCPLDSPHHSTVPGDSRSLWDLQDLSPCTPSLSQSSLPSRGPVTSGYARSFHYGTLSFDPPCPTQLDWPNSLGLTLLARPNSTRSAQLNSLGPTHSAQLTRPTHPKSTQLAWPNSLGPTRPTQLARPNSLGLTHSLQLIRPNPAHLVPLSQPSSLNLPCDQLTGQPTNHLPSGITCSQNPHASLYSPCTHLNDFVVTGGGVM